MSQPIRACVLTISDRCTAGEAEDKSGPALIEMVQNKLQADVAASVLVADETDQIVGQLRAWIHQATPPDLILTTGGTGLSPRDITPEATAQVIERRHDALLDLARMRCYAATPLAFLSRGIAGTAGQSLVINLPGSTRGATETLEALLDILPHAIQTLRGKAKAPGDHRV